MTDATGARVNLAPAEEARSRGLERVIEGMANVANVLSTCAGILLSIFVVLSAVMRYFVGAPLRFSDELVGLLFSAILFLTLAPGLLHDRHVRVTLVIDVLPARAREVADLVSRLVVIAFAAVFAWVSYDFTAMSYMFGSRSEVGDILLYPWMALMPIGVAALALVAIFQIFGWARRGRDGGEGL